MQDQNVSYSPPQKGATAPGLWAAVFTWAGAIASIALIIGIALWTYRLGVRDAQDVPIIQAMAGPAKIAPKDPGGKTVAHQGLAVNEVLAGNGLQQVASVKTAPQAAGLSEEDKPRSQLAALDHAAKPSHRPKFVAAPRAQPVEEAPATMAHVELDDEPVEVFEKLPSVDPSEPLDIKIEKTANKPAAKPTKPNRMLVKVEPDAAPVRAAEPVVEVKVAAAKETPKPADPVVEPKRNVAQALAAITSQEGALADVQETIAETPDEPAVKIASKFAPQNSLSPKPRKRKASRKPEAATQQVASNEAPASKVSPGTRMIQLGAYGSEAVAKRQWEQIISANADLLGQKQRYIQRIKSNGKTFYRLRASSFDTLAASRAACSALTARNVPCIPTVAN